MSAETLTVYLDPSTGEVRESAEPIEGWEPIGPTPYDPRIEDLDEDQILATFARELAEAKGWEAKIEATYAPMIAARDRELAAVERRRAYVRWRYGAVVERIVRDRVSGLERGRHIDTTWGRYQVRRSPESIRVDDERSALRWAAVHCPEAVEKPPLRLRKSDLPRGAVYEGRVPGVRLEPGADRISCEGEKIA